MEQIPRGGTKFEAQGSPVIFISYSWGYFTLGACARVTVVILSVTTLAATCTYLVYESNLRCYRVPYGIPNAKTLYSPILASFADSNFPG